MSAVALRWSNLVRNWTIASNLKELFTPRIEFTAWSSVLPVSLVNRAFPLYLYTSIGDTLRLKDVWHRTRPRFWEEKNGVLTSITTEPDDLDNV
ncbi:predicted protein [Coccidioides posadasii str. Silveira]|uniref:Predicted protein n=1 Tax=Coccidioides posadasii (strain RMSCC 757 / Silveira) TaxID=443226 RepID=E9D1M0_COCPS|nr:predicted protein [Coccidioides posadasii str. Silveira]